MKTAEGGADTTRNTYSSYGAGGAGGKFRKKLLRRQPTPYDRPPTAFRGTNDSSGWLTKVFVDPASKLISYGANRLFASVFRKRLPQPMPRQPPEVKNDASNGFQETLLNNQDIAVEPAGVELRPQIDNSRSNGIFEVEDLLKQKTFSRSEIDRLTELLLSRAAEVSPGEDAQKYEMTAEIGKQEQFSGGRSDETRTEEMKSSPVMFSPVLNSKVLENDIAAPAELAKAYMGNRPSKVSTSTLGMRHQVGRKETMPSFRAFESKSPTMSLAAVTSVKAAPQNGFMTPRSRGRSAIYKMARTPYSRVKPTSRFEGCYINDNSNIGPSMILSTVNTKRIDSQLMTLKRSSSVVDDVGSVGSLRRVRQKPNLFAPIVPDAAHRAGIESIAKQKIQLTGEPSHNFSKLVGETENGSVPSTSHAHVPSRPGEVANRIFQHPETLTPKGKPSESKLASAKGKSLLKLTSSMLSGQALRSMDHVDSPKLLLDVQHDSRLGDSPNATSLDSYDYCFHDRRKVEEKEDPKASLVTCTLRNPVTNNNSTVHSTFSIPTTKTPDSVVENGTTHPPQVKSAFRMSALEDLFEQDDDALCNGIEPTFLLEKAGPSESPAPDTKLASHEVSKLVETRLQQEVTSVPSPSMVSSRTSEFSNLGSITAGEESNIISSPASKEATSTLQFPLPVAAFEKPKEANGPPLFSFSSKVSDKSHALPSESSKKAESKGESSSLINDHASTGPDLPNSEDFNKKSNMVKGLGVSGLSAVPLAVASDDIYQTSSRGASATIFTPSSSVSDLVPTAISTSTSAISNGSILGLSTNSSNLTESPFEFGSSVDPANALSVLPTSKIFEISNARTKADVDPTFSSKSSSSVAELASVHPGNSTFGISSFVGHSTVNNNTQGSDIASPGKSVLPDGGTVSEGTSLSLMPVVGTVSQSTFVLTGSSAVPFFNMNKSSSSGSSVSNSQVLDPSKNLSFSCSSSDTAKAVPGSGSASSVFKFGASPVVPEGTSVSSAGASTPAIFSFGFSSSSSSSTVGSGSEAIAPKFSFGGSSSLINTASSSSSSTSGTFSFGAGSSASSAVNTVGVSTTPNILSSSWQSPTSSTFISGFTSSSASTGFSFGASSTSSASISSVPMSFSSSAASTTPSPFFAFTTASGSAMPNNQPTFGNPPASSFTSSPGNDQMNADDSMAEDPVQSSVPSVSVFGQPSTPPSTPGFTFGSTIPSQPNPFMFGAQQNQVATQNPSPFQAPGNNQIATQNPSPFQASGSLEFNAGGSFSLGSSAVDKSGRKVVKINRSKNRKK